MTESSLKKGVASAFWLSLILAVGWTVCIFPARWLRGESGIWWMTIAVICCLIPGWFVVLLSTVAIVRDQLSAMLIHMMVRLFIVAGVALAIRKLRPELGMVDFYGWLIVFYMLALIVEVRLVKRQLKANLRKAD